MHFIEASAPETGLTLYDCTTRIYVPLSGTLHSFSSFNTADILVALKAMSASLSQMNFGFADIRRPVYNRSKSRFASKSIRYFWLSPRSRRRKVFQHFSPKLKSLCSKQRKLASITAFPWPSCSPSKLITPHNPARIRLQFCEVPPQHNSALMPSFNFMKRSREGPDDRSSKRQKLNNTRSKVMKHRYKAHAAHPYQDSKSSQLSPISPRMAQTASASKQLRRHSTMSTMYVQSHSVFSGLSLSRPLLLCHITFSNGTKSQ